MYLWRVIQINLPTVMPGYLLYDFGDMVRTMASTGNEEVKEISTIGFRLDVFESICIGFNDAYKHTLTCDEKEGLVLSGSYMALIMAIRFLTDFLNNDVYYKTSYHLHNLNRSLNQLKLVESIQ